MGMLKLALGSFFDACGMIAKNNHVYLYPMDPAVPS